MTAMCEIEDLYNGIKRDASGIADYGDVDGRVKLSQKWSLRIEPLGRGIGDLQTIPNSPFRVKLI
jgi:hypothetical protein